jgi:hypothetical protein
MSNRTESNAKSGAELTARPARRFGLVTLFLVMLAAFWAGGMVRNGMAKSYETELRASFPFMMQLNSPVTIQVEWNAVEKEIPGTDLYKAYAGPATYIVKNKSERPMKLVFPPQNCFRFSENGFAPRDPEDIPEWARQSFVLTLNPGEKRQYEEAHTVTACGVSDQRYGPFAFDFAAPSNTDPTEYVTGTVFCSIKANVTKSNSQ